MKKKILIISPYFPYPPHDGGKVRIFNLLKYLSLKNEIYLLSYIEKSVEKEYIQEISKYCKKLFTVIRDESKRIIDKNIPRSNSFFYTPEMIEMLYKVINEVRKDE